MAKCQFPEGLVYLGLLFIVEQKLQFSGPDRKVHKSVHSSLMIEMQQPPGRAHLISLSFFPVVGRYHILVGSLRTLGLSVCTSKAQRVE